MLNFTTLTIAGVLLTGCATASVPPPASDALLVSIESSGGMCVYGMCESTVKIFEDGRCVRSQGGSSSAAAQIPAADIAKLKQAIQAENLAAVRSHAFTGTCPVAYDGTSLTYKFTQNGTPQSLNDCHYDLDEPLFTLIDNLSC